MNDKQKSALADVPQAHLSYLSPIANEDVEGIMRAEQQYGSSWKRRGGVGAYMMLCRKFDRIEQALSRQPLSDSDRENLRDTAESMVSDGAEHPGTDQATYDLLMRAANAIQPYDLFAHAEADKRPEGLIDDIRDLRRYLLLVEAELRARGIGHGAHRDNVDA